MKKLLKAIMYILLTFILLVIIILYWFKFIDYYFFSIKPEYSNLSKKELNQLDNKLTPWKKDLMDNITSYEALKDYLIDNNHTWIRKESNWKIYIHRPNERDNYSIQDNNIYSLMNELWIYFISDNNISKNNINKWIIFTKENIRIERWHSFWYIYYEWDLPQIIEKENIKLSIKKINDNWLIYDLKYFYE